MATNGVLSVPARLATNSSLRPLRPGKNLGSHNTGWVSIGDAENAAPFSARYKEFTFSPAFAPWKNPGTTKNRCQTMYRWGVESVFETQGGHNCKAPAPFWCLNDTRFTHRDVEHRRRNYEERESFPENGLKAIQLQDQNTPYSLMQRCFGKKDKNCAIICDFHAKLSSPERYSVSHSAEYAAFKRVKNPENAGVSSFSDVHFRRLSWEMKHHQMEAKDLFVQHGTVGSDPASSVQICSKSDNAAHSYLHSIFQCRHKDFFAPNHIKYSQNPFTLPNEIVARGNEVMWNRPPLRVDHFAGYEHELPRVAEEFGGPLPKDLGLSSKDGANFVVHHPYSIPMRGIIGGVTDFREWIKSAAFLSARWAYYADSLGHVTLPGDAFLRADGKGLTVLINMTRDAVDLSNSVNRLSKHLLGAHHVKFGDGHLSRCWDAIALDKTAVSSTQYADFVDLQTNVLFRPLSTTVGETGSLGRRFFPDREGKGGILQHGLYQGTNATPVAKASAGGHLFGAPAASTHASRSRPSRMHISDVTFVVVGGGNDPADAVAKQIQAQGWLYAELGPLKDSINAVFQQASVVCVPQAEAAVVNKEIASSGAYNKK